MKLSFHVILVIVLNQSLYFVVCWQAYYSIAKVFYGLNNNNRLQCTNEALLAIVWQLISLEGCVAT